MVNGKVNQRDPLNQESDPTNNKGIYAVIKVHFNYHKKVVFY